MCPGLAFQHPSSGRSVLKRLRPNTARRTLGPKAGLLRPGAQLRSRRLGSTLPPWGRGISLTSSETRRSRAESIRDKCLQTAAVAISVSLRPPGSGASRLPGQLTVRSRPGVCAGLRSHGPQAHTTRRSRHRGTARLLARLPPPRPAPFSLLLPGVGERPQPFKLHFAPSCPCCSCPASLYPQSVPGPGGVRPTRLPTGSSWSLTAKPPLEHSPSHGPRPERNLSLGCGRQLPCPHPDLLWTLLRPTPLPPYNGADKGSQCAQSVLGGSVWRASLLSPLFLPGVCQELPQCLEC